MIGTLLLNRYEILEKIGEGGMGVVYKAKCTILNRFVAIKVLKKDLNNSDDFIARFKREANSIASLSHPNIVNIHDVAYEDNINFLVMEYVNGKSLTQTIKENGKLSTEMTLDISLQITKALEIAHRNNIIHRDIKPDNILITEDNIVKLMDFGIAKVADSVSLTSSNIVMGSVHYISPEQAKGEAVDCRTDLYSFGIVMYQMLTGQVPFKGENSVYTVLKHINEPVIPPKNIVQDLPEEINRIILKALEKDPTNRIQNAKEFTEALNSIKETFKRKHDSMDDTVIISTQSDLITSEKKYDETIIMDQEEIPETNLIEKTPENTKKTKSTWSTKKKIILSSIVVVILSTIALGTFLLKGNSTNNSTTTQNTNTENTNENGTKSSTDNNNKKQVPSLLGKKQDVAKKLINDNGFLPGNITNDYSDNVPKGYVIKQSPQSNTYSDNKSKIDLVISKGPKKSDSKKNDDSKSKDKNNDDGDDD